MADDREREEELSFWEKLARALEVVPLEEATMSQYEGFQQGRDLAGRTGRVAGHHFLGLGATEEERNRPYFSDAFPEHARQFDSLRSGMTMGPELANYARSIGLEPSSNQFGALTVNEPPDPRLGSANAPRGQITGPDGEPVPFPQGRSALLDDIGYDFDNFETDMNLGLWFAAHEIPATLFGTAVGGIPGGIAGAGAGAVVGEENRRDLVDFLAGADITPEMTGLDAGLTAIPAMIFGPYVSPQMRSALTTARQAGAHAVNNPFAFAPWHTARTAADRERLRAAAHPLELYWYGDTSTRDLVQQLPDIEGFEWVPSNLSSEQATHLGRYMELHRFADELQAAGVPLNPTTVAALNRLATGVAHDVTGAPRRGHRTDLARAAREAQSGLYGDSYAAEYYSPHHATRWEGDMEWNPGRRPNGNRRNATEYDLESGHALGQGDSIIDIRRYGNQIGGGGGTPSGGGSPSGGGGGTGGGGRRGRPASEETLARRAQRAEEDARAAEMGLPSDRRAWSADHYRAMGMEPPQRGRRPSNETETPGIGHNNPPPDDNVTNLAEVRQQRADEAAARSQAEIDAENEFWNRHEADGTPPLADQEAATSQFYNNEISADEYLERLGLGADVAPREQRFLQMADLDMDRKYRHMFDFWSARTRMAHTALNNAHANEGVNPRLARDLYYAMQDDLQRLNMSNTLEGEHFDWLINSVPGRRDGGPLTRDPFWSWFMGTV